MRKKQVEIESIIVAKKWSKGNYIQALSSVLTGWVIDKKQENMKLTKMQSDVFCM